MSGAKAQAESRPEGAQCGPTSHEPPGRPRRGESAGSGRTGDGREVGLGRPLRWGMQEWRGRAEVRQLARSRIQVWLYEQVNMRIEGCIIGFDEYMNLVLDDAEEIHSKTKSRKQLGRIMLKGDNITLLQSVSN
ncbi:small nuclear ribonucleoprotein E isoform X1 [Eulemur rufifrons]|uniref:small nuclear ribonucleoprotein E isoform X1 n=1 Tax=Eulemur rufifrons TaxID=859984 RepID=UPI00374458D1